MVSWSGGKDSTYTLWLLTNQYNLRVLAFTLDNGFVSPTAFQNMRVVAENVGVDHIVVKPRFDFMKKAFLISMKPGLYPPRALERASGICNTCMALAKGIGLRIALERDIPMLAYGWSPGQVPSASALFCPTSQMLRSMVKAAMAPLSDELGSNLTAYFPESHQLNDRHQMPCNVSPLAFLDYVEEESLEQIRALGWERPHDTDPNSTNCLLNTFANVFHLSEMGYHPYAMELSGLVRQGHVSREEAIERLELAPMQEVISAVEAKLGIRALSGNHLQR
jgi:tRNA(Ile)-lysidine synthase TilS/MesJ